MAGRNSPTHPLLENGSFLNRTTEVPYEQQKPYIAVIVVLIISIVMCRISVAQEEGGVGVAANFALKPGMPPIDKPNTLWVMISTALVMIMTPGLSLYYGGMVADEQVLNRMVRTFVNLGLIAVQWCWFGYSLAFAPSNPYTLNLLGDFSFAAMRGVGTSPRGAPIDESYGIPHLSFMTYQLMFAATTTTILSGAIANYMSFRSLCAFIVLWTTLVYDPICHAVWGGGYLSNHLDFAGGTVIHLLSGVSATAAATYLNYLTRKEKQAQMVPAHARSLKREQSWIRRGSLEEVLENLHQSKKFDPTTDLYWDRALGGPTVAHNATYVVLGVVLIWFGWCGFNGGSAYAPDAIAAAALANTNLAAGFGMIAWMQFEVWAGGTPSAVGAATGAVCGLVGITPSAGYVPTLMAGPIGLISSGVSFLFVWLDVYQGWFKWMSNPQDVMATHGLSGLVGSLLTGLFAYKPVNPGETRLTGNGLLFGGNLDMFFENCYAVTVVSLYGIVVTIIIIHGLKSLNLP